MNLLAFDTSSPVLSVALKKGDAAISESKLTGFFKHAENLLPMIDGLLKEKKLTLSKIDAFLIGQGPGSFTGLRIGFATLKSFMVFKKRPCLGALSLDMIAANANLQENSRLAVCLDARREKIYARFYHRQKEEWQTSAAAEVLSLEELIQALPEGSYLSGDALIRYGDVLKKGAAKKNIRFMPESSWYPKASTLIKWHQAHNKNLKKLTRPKDFLPLYFRGPGASATIHGGSVLQRRKKSKHYVTAC